MFNTVLKCLILLAFSITANATIIGFKLQITTTNGSGDEPVITLTNSTTAGTAFIRAFELTIGDTSKGWDHSRGQSTAIAGFTGSATPVAGTLASPDAGPNATRSDVLRWEFNGPQAGPAPLATTSNGAFDVNDRYRMRAELDTDGIQDTVDFRNILYNNGALPNAVITVWFSSTPTGPINRSLSGILSDRPVTADNEWAFTAVPEPGPTAMMSLGVLAIGFGRFRRRS